MFLCFCTVCPADKRKYYQANLLRFISNKRTESGHVEPSAEPGATRDPTAEPRLKTPAKIAIYWMFDELDVSPNDRRLSREEAKNFLAETSREVAPRACADDQWSYCDYNNDDFISLSEWCWCTGLDPSESCGECQGFYVCRSRLIAGRGLSFVQNTSEESRGGRGGVKRNGEESRCCVRA